MDEVKETVELSVDRVTGGIEDVLVDTVVEEFDIEARGARAATHVEAVQRELSLCSVHPLRSPDFQEWTHPAVVA